ncbi:MAG: hypothetical protein PF795_05290, partial [Kiritimatiellae bacterium]|nr:hypothetical protein [Kiritimatiellia bacterium]
TYNAAGRMTGETTAEGNQGWTYDDFGGVATWTVDGVQQFEVLETDLLGRPTEIQDSSGTREITYDNFLWAPDTVEWTSGPLQGFKLDEGADSRGRLGTLTVSKELTDLYTVTHAYRGESDRIDTLSITVPGIASPILINVNGDGGVADELIYSFGGQPIFTYSRARDGNGRLNGISAPGLSQSWTPDAMGRVHQLTTNGETTTFGYDPGNGSLASADSPDTARAYTFTDRGELQEEELDEETLLATLSPDQSGGIAGRENPRDLTLYGSVHTNAVAEILVGTNLVHSTTITPFSYTFDETTLPALADPNAVVSFDWSVVGTLPGVEYEGGQAVSKVRGFHRFGPRNEPVLYDTAARRSSDTFLNYGWNGANQALMLEERHGPHRTEHEYDGNQRRVEKRVYHNGNLQRIHRFVYEGWLPVVEEVTDKWGNLEYRNMYVWGPGPDGVRNPGIGATGQLALIIHQPKFGPPRLSAPIYNHRLDIVALIDVENGNVVAKYEYSPFGELLSATGSRAEQNPFRFAGAYFDGKTKTSAFGYRHYHPRTKQWISRDPIGEAGGLNLFAYCNNDPVNGVDVLGLDAIRTSADGGVWWVLDGADREVYLGVANVEPRFFGLMTSVSDELQLNASLGGGTVSRSNLKKLAAGKFFGHAWLFGQKFRTSTSSQDNQIRNIIDQRLNPHGLPRIGASTRMSAEEHAFRSNRALATSGLLLGSPLSGYTDEGAQIAEFNANLYTRSMLPSAIGTRAATTIFAAESGYILGNSDSTALDRGLAAFDLGLMFISLPGNPNRLATSSDEAVFWSGVGRGGDKRAAAWVARNGGATLETTLASRGINLPTWNAADPSVVAAWRQASIDFASGASGNVRVLQGTSLRIDAIFRSEFEALIANPKVRSIMAINPETGLETLLWSR